MATNITPSLLTLAEISSKGRAVFATSPIPKGTLILSEAPLLTLSPSPTSITDLLEDYKSLPSTTKDYLLDLTSHASLAFREYVTKQLTCLSWTSRKITPWMQLLLGVFDANALGPNLCLRGAMFNHSCAPNACTSFDDDAGEQTFFAVRDIAAGEEITISYLGGEALFASKSERQSLLAHRGFICCCNTCAKVEEDELNGVRNSSEELREQWRVLKEKYERNDGRLLKNFGTGDHHGVDCGFIKFLRDVVVGMVEVQERLEVYDLELLEWYERIVGLSLRLGEREVAEVWRRRMVEFVRGCVGEGHPVYCMVKQRIQDGWMG